MKWVEEMNKMFEANEFTDKGRVTVDFCENANIVVVCVCENRAIIDNNIEGLSNYGLMMRCMKVIEELYDK